MKIGGGGAPRKYDVKKVDKAVEEWLTSDLSAKEVGEKYNIPHYTIMYQVSKRRKQDAKTIKQ